MLLENDRIEMALQPILQRVDVELVDTLGNAFCYYEALARRVAPDGSYQNSAAFLQDMDIESLTDVSIEMLRQADQYLSGFNYAQRPTIFVNVHPHTLADPNLAGKFMSSLLGIQNRNLIAIEITEEITADNLNVLTSNVRDISQIHFPVAVDDYQWPGPTESPHQSRVLPFASYIKVRLKDILTETPEVPQEFKGFFCQQHHTQYGRRVIFEMINNAGELAKAIELGAHMFQGFHFGKPMLASELGLPAAPKILKEPIKTFAQDERFPIATPLIPN